MEKRLLLVLSLILPSLAMAWWNHSLPYRLPVQLNNGGSGLTGYQEYVTVNTATLISAGIYDLQFRFADNSTAWKNGTVFS